MGISQCSSKKNPKITLLFIAAILPAHNIKQIAMALTDVGNNSMDTLPSVRLHVAAADRKMHETIKFCVDDFRKYMEPALTPARNIVTTGMVFRCRWPARRPDITFPSRQLAPMAAVLLKTLQSKSGTQLVLLSRGGRLASCDTVTVELGYFRWKCSKRVKSSGNQRPRPKQLK